MDEVDQAKTQLQSKTQEALDYLVGQNVVSEDDGEYRFLQEEEIRIKNRIDNFRIPPGEQIDFLEKDVVGRSTGWSRSTSLDGSKIQLHRKVDGKEIGASGTVPVQFLITQSRDPNQLAFDRAKKDLVFCLNEQFGPKQQAKLKEVVRIDAFKRANYDRTSGKRREAIEMFAEQSQQSVKELRDWFEDALKSCSYVSNQQVKDASDHNGGSAAERYENILDAHLRELYDKRELAVDYAGSRSELQKEAADTQTDFDKSLTPAETEVHSYLQRETGPNAADRTPKPSTFCSTWRRKTSGGSGGTAKRSTARPSLKKQSGGAIDSRSPCMNKSLSILSSCIRSRRPSIRRSSTRR